MARRRRCGSLVGLSFAQLPLFITAAGRHNNDKGLRRLAAEILCVACEVCRLVERGTADQPHPPSNTTRLLPSRRTITTSSRRLFRGDVCQLPRSFGTFAQPYTPNGTGIMSENRNLPTPSLFVNLRPDASHRDWAIEVARDVKGEGIVGYRWMFH